MTPGFYPAQKSNLWIALLRPSGLPLNFCRQVVPDGVKRSPGWVLKPLTVSSAQKRANAAFHLLGGLGCCLPRRRGTNALKRPDAGETVRGPLR